jgi:hypothetical protein
VALLALGGCAGIGEDDAGAIKEAELASLVLQPDDLTGSWLLFDEGRQATADAPLGPRGDPTRFGRVEGWKARYRRSGTAATRGPLVVESRADLFAGEDGAEDDFRALEEDLEAGRLLGAAERLDAPTLGDETVAATLRQGEGDAVLRYFVVAWRQDGVTASVLVNGFDRGTKLSDALALARKQQRRIEAASAE